MASQQDGKPLVKASKSTLFPPSELINEQEWRALEEAYGLHAHDPDEHATIPLCEKPVFELVIGIAIALNALVMALELDLSDKDAPFRERIPWIVTDVLFCTIFSCECAFRIRCIGFSIFFEVRFLADVVLVVLNVVDTGIQLSGSGTTGLQSLSALRILRLFKMMKVFRIVSHVKELSLIATGLVSALKSLQYVSLLLTLVIFVMAIMFKILVGRECHSTEMKISYAYHFGDHVEPGAKCEEYWGTVLRSMYTLYQVTTLESWSQVIARPIWDVRPYYMIFILSFQLITTFGLLNIVVAAVVDGTMNSSDELVVENTHIREIISHLRTLRDIFIMSVDPSIMKVTAERFIPTLLSPVIRRKLLLLNIEYDDPSQIFRILDTKDEKAIDVTDFVKGFIRIRGTAKSKDLLGIRAQLYRCERNLMAKLTNVESSTFDTATSSKPQGESMLKDLGGKLDSMAAESKEGMGRLSDELHRHMDSFVEEVRGRMDSLEGNVSRASSSKMVRDERTGPQAPILVQSAEAKLSGPIYITKDISGEGPRDGSGDRKALWPPPNHNEMIWTKLCCTPSVGSDRQSVGQKMVNLVRPTLPAIQEATELQAILTREHESLVWQLDEKHRLLLNKLGSSTRPRSERSPGQARLPEEPLLPSRGPASSDAQTEQSAASEEPKQSAATEALMKLEPKEQGSVGSVMSTVPYMSDAGAQTDAIHMSLISPKENVPDPAPAGGATPTHAGSTAQAIESKHALSAAAWAEKRNNSAAATPLTFTERAEAFVTGAPFESTFALLITLNALVMATETQYWGIDTGYKIKFPGSYRSAKEAWPGAENVFYVLEITFGLFFVAELVVKVAALRVKFLCSWWNWLDFLIVGSWCLDTGFGVQSFLNPMMLRLFRLVKLLRVAKLFKTFQAFDSLSLLIHSLKASVSILFWSIVVIFVLQIIAALFFSQVLVDYLSPEEDQRARSHLVYEHFGTFTRSIVTMLEVTIGQWGPVCHVLVENVSEWYAFFIVGYVLMVSFATIKVISAVFILETQKLAATDEEILIMEKDRANTRLDSNITAVFKEIDDGGDGSVNWEEFQAIIHDHRVNTWLAALDLDTQHCENIFSLIDDGDGKITSKEFLQGVRRLKGAAKSVDLVNVAMVQNQMNKAQKRLLESVEELKNTSGGMRSSNVQPPADGAGS